jgi:hypothetical protein
MSRHTQALDPSWLQRELTAEEREAQEQAADCFTLDRAKDVLTALRRSGRLTSAAYDAGVAALCASLHATENPGIKQINLEWGARLARAQAVKRQEAKHVNF